MESLYLKPVAEIVSGSPKLPPQALEAEQSLLGGLLLDNRRWDEVNDEVGMTDFYSQNHRLIFGAIRNLQGSSDPADVITVSEWLENNGSLDDAGGLAGLSMRTITGSGEMIEVPVGVGSEDADTWQDVERMREVHG